ncbi:ThuA domain-containing protein [Streptomyces sp. NPDC019396]|uniref:ThuA domain-containing protein n=1 Tax=Streptomyces sp. NPDC019396 TaxID=3154687 RepID=UPI0033D9942F
MSSTSALRVTVWNEGVHEAHQDPPHISRIYPQGLHGAIASAILSQIPDAVITTALLDDAEHGLTDEVLHRTDVLVWWGHIAHDRVEDHIVERVHNHVLGGMGLMALHSAHFSKIFIRLMGTTCALNWRDEGERELLWTVAPAHPITQGIPSPVIIPEQECYSEFFDIPEPDELLFISSFQGGEVFRSGATFTRGKGRIFYFSPGDQAYPVYHQLEIQRILANGIRWCVGAARDRAMPEVRNIPAHWFCSDSQAEGSPS